MPALVSIAADAPDLRSALETAELPTDDIAEPGRSFFRYDDGGEPVGYGGYELHGEHVLLRSVVVLPTRRGKGLGRDLAEAVLAEAAAAGARRAWLLTTTAEDFFVHWGFSRIHRNTAPQAILETRQAATICTTAALLTRTLDG